MDTRKLKADITETAYWDRNSMDPRREDLTELRNEDGETVAYSSHEENTAELVRRWNAYPELVEALRMITLAHNLALKSTPANLRRTINEARALLQTLKP